MELLEKFNEAMKLTESKRSCVEKAMISLLVEWKNLENVDSSTQRLLHDCFTHIQSRRNQLNIVDESLTSSSQVLNEIAESLEERLEEVESKEKEFVVMQEKISNELELKMKKLNFCKGFMERGLKDFDLREKKIDEQKKLIEDVFEKFSLERSEFERIKSLIEEKFEEVKLKAKNVEICRSELDGDLVEFDVKMKNVVEKEKEFELKEKSIKTRESKLEKFMVECALKLKNAEEKEKQVGFKEKTIENRETELDRVLAEFDLKMKDVVKKESEVGLKEKSIENRETELDRVLAEFDFKMKDVIKKESGVGLKEKSIENRETELDRVLAEFDFKMKDVLKKESEVRLMEKSVENREIELNRGLVEFDVKMKTVDEKDREFELKKKSIENREIELGKGLVEFDVKMNNVEEKEKELELKVKSFEKRNTELDRALVEFDLIRKNVEEKKKEFEVKEKSIENREIELDRLLIESDEKMKNVVEKEKEVELKLMSIENRETELDDILVDLDAEMKNVVEKEQEVELKLKSIENRETEIDGFLAEFDAEMKNIVEKEKEVESKVKSIQNREIELDRSLVEFELKMKNVVEKEKELELKEKTFEKRDIELDGALVEFDLIRKNVVEKEKEVELKSKSIENREVELDRGLVEFDVKMKNVVEKEKELELKEKTFQKRDIELDGALVEFDLMIKNVVEKEKELELKEKTFEKRDIELDGALVEFDLIKKNVEEKDKELEVKEKSIENRKTVLESKENEINFIKISCEERCRKLELEKEKLEEQIKKLKVKNKQFSNLDHSTVKPEPWSDDGSYADIRFSITMDGKNLLLYLINHKRDLDSMTDEVCKALKLSMDPAKLVLDAVQEFYVKKEDKEFEEDVVCRSSILLLEQLRRISPRIQSYHKKAALELASKWKGKMRSSAEVIVFLQLLASYRLGSAFEPEEFSSLFEVIGQQIQISELFQLLGYTDKISDLIQVMLKKQQHVKAVRYVCAFGLRNRFQPALFLKDFLKNSVEAAKNLLENINSPVYKKDAVIDNIVASLREALVCIFHYKLESEFSPKCIEIFIQQLIQKKEDEKVRLLVSNNNAEKQQKAEENCESAKSVSDPTETCPTWPDLEANGPVLDTKGAMAVILADMDGKSLQLFLNKNAEDHELICNNVFDGLKLSEESAKLVLDAIQGFYPPHLEMGDKHYESPVIMRSCILLLEQLMKLSPEIKPQVKEDAVILALDWKAKMRTPLQILGFLHLIASYGLNSNFDLSELEKLFETVSYLQHVPQLCRLIRFSETSPNHTSTSSSNFYCQHKTIPGKKQAKFIQSVNSVKLVLDAMWSCYYSNLNGNRSLKCIVVKSFILLTQKLLTMPHQVQPHVKEVALKFALDWKTRLVDGGSRNPTEVFGFFHLLALYRVASSVDLNELFGLLDCIYQQRKSPDIVRLLGLEHKIPDLIESLIQKGDRLQAIRYIYEFKLVGKFPPGPILKDHISFDKVLAEKTRGKKTSRERKGDVNGKQLASLTAIVKCIEDYQLEDEYPPENLFAQIQQLNEQPKKNTKTADMRKKFGKKRHAAGPDLGPEAQTRCKRKCIKPLVETSLNVLPTAFF